MQLSHETLAQCVTCLRRDTKDRLGHERRLLPRFAVSTPIPIEPGPAGEFEPFVAWIRDVSRGGVGLMYTRPIERGTQFVIDLPHMEGESHRLLCQVVYCAGGVPGMYSIGARFVRRADAPATGTPATAAADVPPRAA